MDMTNSTGSNCIQDMKLKKKTKKKRAFENEDYIRGCGEGHSCT